jgi:UDP-glucose 4-epimerase
MRDKRVFITGGAGYLGSHIVDKYHKSNAITVYSRDEAKHYYLSKKYPNVRFIIGDVRNQDHLIRSCANHDVGIFAASLKQIDTCSKNIEESVQTIVHGAINSKRAAIDNNFESACFISTDKSRSATTVYGAMKYVAGESFILNNEDVQTKCSTALYGNVMNSTGSLIPLIRNAIQNDICLTLYSEEMTRFMITVDEAIDIVDTSLTLRDVTVVPNLKSFLVRDVFDIYKEEFGLKYKIGTPRINEKIHEIMASGEEIPRMLYLKEKDCYIMDSHVIYSEVIFPSGVYSSRDSAIDKESLHSYLKEKNFYL